MTEKDYGGAVQGVVEPPRLQRLTKQRMFLPKGSNKAIEQAAEAEQDTGRALPEPSIRSTPKKFGEFSKRK